MKKFCALIISLNILFALSACSSKTTTTIQNAPSTVSLEDTTPTTDLKEEDNIKSLELKIDDIIVTVTWKKTHQLML